MTSYIAKSIPYEEIEIFTLNAGFSHIYPVEKPEVPIVGNWKERYCCLSDSFKPILDKIHNFEVREDDIWVLTNPKCGTTWMQELVYLVTHDFDYETAKSVDLGIRSPFIDFNGLASNMDHMNAFELAENAKSPRVMKSHLPSFLLPKQLWTKKPKIIYVFRDPKDAAISYYHHWCGMISYKGTKEQFMNAYMDDHIIFTPFWKNTLDFWHLRNENQIFFTSYDLMKKDLSSVLKNVCKFLNKPITEEEVVKAVEHLSFDNMRKNPQVNHEKQFEALSNAAGKPSDDYRFVRRGVVGSHKDEMPSELVEKFNNWTKKNLSPYNVDINDIITYCKY